MKTNFNGRGVQIEDFLDHGQAKKKQRTRFIMNLLESLKEVDRKKFLGLVSTEYGIRRKTLQEYLRDFQDYGIIEILDDKIKWIGKQDESEEPED